MYLAIVGHGWAANKHPDVAIFEATNHASANRRHQCTVYVFESDTAEGFEAPTVDQMGRICWPEGVTCTIDQRGWVERESFVDSDALDNLGSVHRTSLEPDINEKVPR